MILGTAGHIDHGKTALVAALTGVNTDRLPEERQRGITIELGFAPLDLGDGLSGSVVDVPGHEALVRTMVAGAAGIDAALLVVAADDGVMPQTREHLRVLTALGVSHGVVAITKSDLVEPEWLALVTDDVSVALADTSLAGVAILPVSARTGAGLAALRQQLAALARGVAERARDDLFRFVVDRAFTIRGTGTVVTGTVWSGAAESGSRVTVLPGPAEARIRSIHSHGVQLERAERGARFALALANVSPDQVPHGSQIVSDSTWTASRLLYADVWLSEAVVPAGAPTGRVRRNLMLHLAGAEARARITFLHPQPELAGVSVGAAVGTRVGARVLLDRRVTARAGDRFVLRSLSPADTVGGGTVVDPLPERGSRGAWGSPSSGATERLASLLWAAGSAGVPIALLPVRLGVPPRQVPAIVARADGCVVGEWVVGRAALDALAGTITARVAAWHSEHPLDGGIPLARLREELRAPGTIVEAAVARVCEAGRHALGDGTLALKTGQSALSERNAALMARLLQLVTDGGSQPPSVAELEAECGASAEGLLRYAARHGNLVAVEGVRYYDPAVVASQVARLRGGMQPEREYSPQELRDLLGVSRKYLIPFLEYCDRVGVTVRRSGGRVIQHVSSA